MSTELLLAMFATVVALSFPFCSWTQMLAAVEVHEEWRQLDRDRRAHAHREVIDAALASLPPLIVDLRTSEGAAQNAVSARWAPSGFIPASPPSGGRG